MYIVGKSMAANCAEEVFTEGQWKEIQRLVSSLDSRQSAWLSGYLAGLKHDTPAVAQSNSPASEVLVAFGSETGNSEKIAGELLNLLSQRGTPAVVKNLSSLRPRQLSKYQYALLICSTHGDGDPPEPVTNFFTTLMEKDAPRLPDLNYAVLSLGDSSYEHFCTAGKQLDERLASLGAVRLAFRQDCDVDFAVPAKHWMNDVIKTLPGSAAPVARKPVARTETEAGYSKENPLTVSVLENLCLSDSERPEPIHHIELSLEVSDFKLNPGDAVGVLAKNPSTLVDRVLEAAKLAGEQSVTINHRNIPLAQALLEECDLNIPSKSFLEKWAQASGSKELKTIVEGDAKEQRSFLRSHQILDLIGSYPASVSAQNFVESLRPLQPRLYDVANSLNAMDDELHLTVKRYNYPFRDRHEIGVASDYLVNLPKNAALKIYPHRNARFHLPEKSDAPLILVADGTGIAPFRAFMQEMKASGLTHPCWLVFSEQSFEEDFLYQTEWQEAVDEGLLERVDSVFYQDQPNRSLADLLIEQNKMLLDWIKAGAHLYLCGDKSLLGNCETTLQAWLEKTATQGVNWQSMNAGKRIHRNVY